MSWISDAAGPANSSLGDPSGEEPRGGEMPKVVQADASQAESAAEEGELVGHVVRRPWLGAICRPREDVGVLENARAAGSCSLLRAFSVLVQDLDRRRIEGDSADRVGLRVLLDECPRESLTTERAIVTVPRSRSTASQWSAQSSPRRAPVVAASCKNAAMSGLSSPPFR
jgi:hypothetical protein